MTNIMVSLLCILAHIPSLVLRFVPFKELVSKWQRNWIWSVYGVGLLADFMLCLWMAQRNYISISFYKINLLLFCVLMGVVNIVVIRGHLKEHLFTFGLTAVIVWIVLAIAAYITGRIGYQTIEQGLIIENILGILMYAALYPCFRKLMMHTVKPFLGIESENYWNTVWFIPIALFLSGILSHGPEEYTATFLQVISRILIGIAALFICHNIAMDYRRIQEKNQMNQQIEMQKKYYQALTTAVETEREVLHNFKHQLAVIKRFQETGNSAELKEYCDSLELNLADITEIPYTGNAAADGVLYHYACVAKERRISFTVCCKLNGLPIADADLCCILGNALDNAVTACEKYDRKRYISIAAQRENKLLLLTIDNSFDGVLLQKEGKILSKKRKDEEGIGIRYMKQICEKYGGTSRFQADGSRFEASFMLPL